MDSLGESLPFDQLPAETLTFLANWGSVHIATFLLIATRLAGLLLFLPAWSGGSVSWHLRLMLILTLAGVLTPLISARSAPSNSSDSAPATIQLASNEVAVEEPSAELFSLGFVKEALAELVFGAALGFGILLVISSLQMAGELIDPQCGFQSNRLFEYDTFGEGSITGKLLLIVGLMGFLVLPADGVGSQGGLMLLVQSFLDTFESVPVGAALVKTGVADILVALVHHSIALCLLVAAPVLACATLLSVLFGVANRMVPEMNHQSYAVPVRTVCCLAILVFSLSGAAGLLTREIPIVLQQIQSLLTA